MKPRLRPCAKHPVNRPVLGRILHWFTQNRKGRKQTYVSVGFVSVPTQVKVSHGIKAALSSLLVTVARPNHIGTHAVQSLKHFGTLQTDVQAHLKGTFWCSLVTCIGVKTSKEFTARGKKKSNLLTCALKSNPLKLIPTFF